MIHFWAKTTPEGKPGISVYDHMLNVGCVARCITEIWPEVLNYFHLRSEEAGVLAALHDLGKISPGPCSDYCQCNTPKTHINPSSTRNCR